MEIGQRIISGLYDEYGAGTIISQRKLFGKLFYKVFFEAVGKTRIQTEFSRTYY